LKGETKPYETRFKKNLEEEWVAPVPLPPMPKDFKEYPERDLVNYPFPARFMYAPKTRMLMFPDSWFTAFYNITGISGIFGILCIFFINIQLWNQKLKCSNFQVLTFSFLALMPFYQLNNYLFRKVTAKHEKYKKLMADELADCQKKKKDVIDTVESIKLIKENFPSIFEENMAIQLEAAYRKNVEMVNMEMKRRLDYLRETQETKKRFAKEHMLKWIIDSVTFANLFKLIFIFQAFNQKLLQFRRFSFT
uniref:ATP synthase subunit b n=1 Tax=Dracunculus medinensis TaxID=318479 RepID=A0A0N4UDN7_DRAME